MDETQLQAEWGDIAARLSRLAAEQARRDAEVATVLAVIGKLEATLPLALQREGDVGRLVAQGFMSHHAGQDRSRERLELERDLAAQQARLVEARAGGAEARRATEAYRAEARRILSDRLVAARLQQQQLSQAQVKADQRARRTRLTSPVAGTVQQLAVHTAGGVVTPAQVLMVIVPTDAPVTAEVIVDNKDVGFVGTGQWATLKLETFPFTRYGTVDAQVTRMSADAVADEQRGAVFPATLTLQRDRIDIDGKSIRLTPGMNLTAEIGTGRRRVIDYLLGPVMRTVDESLGER